MAKNISTEFGAKVNSHKSKFNTSGTKIKDLKENTTTNINRALAGQSNRALLTALSYSERDLGGSTRTLKELDSLSQEAHQTDDSNFSQGFESNSVLTEDTFSSTKSSAIKSSKQSTSGSSRSIILAQKLQTEAQYDIAKKIQSSNNRLSMKLHADKMTQDLRYQNSSLKDFAAMKTALNRMTEYQVSIQSDYYKKSLEVKSNILNELREIKSDIKLGFNINANTGKKDESKETEALAKVIFGGDFKTGIKKGLHQLIADKSSQATGGLTSMLGMLPGMMAMGGGMSAKSLMAMGMKEGIKGYATKKFGSSKVDKFSVMMNDPGQFATDKLNGMQFSQNSLLRALAETFGDKKQSFASVKYDEFRKKDPNAKAQFDVKAHKSLTDIIPTSLAKIEAALTGGKLKLYNHKSQRYEEVSAIHDKAKSAFSNKEAAEANRLEKTMAGNSYGSVSKIIDELGDSDVSGILKGKILANPAAKEGFIRALRSFLYKIKAKSKGKSLQTLLSNITVSPSFVLQHGEFNSNDPWPHYISMLIESSKYDKKADVFLGYLLNEANRIESVYEDAMNDIINLEHSSGMNYIMDNMKTTTTDKNTYYSYDKSIFDTSRGSASARKAKSSFESSSEVFIALDKTFNSSTSPFHKRELYMAHNLEVPKEWLDIANEREAIALFGPRGLNYYNDAIRKLSKKVKDIEGKPNGVNTLEYTVAKNSLDILVKNKNKIFSSFEESGGVSNVMKQFEESNGRAASFDYNYASIDPISEITSFTQESLKSYKVRSGIKVASAGAIGVLASMYAKNLGYGKMSTPLIGASIAGSLMMNHKMQGMVDMLGDKRNELMSDGRTRGQALQTKLMQEMLPVGFATATGLAVNKFTNNYVPYGKLLGPVMGWAAGSMMMKIQKGFLGKKFSSMLNKGLDLMGGFGDSIRKKFGLAAGQERYSMEEILGTRKKSKRSMKRDSKGIDKENRGVQGKYKDLKLASGASLAKVGCGIFSVAYAVGVLIGQKVLPEDFIPIANKYIDPASGGIKLEFFIEVGNRLGLNVHIANAADPKVDALLTGIGPKKKVAIALTNIDTGHYVVAFKSSGDDALEIFDPNSDKTDVRSAQGLKMQSAAIIIMEASNNSSSVKSSILSNSGDATTAKVDTNVNVNPINAGSGPGDSKSSVSSIKTDKYLKKVKSDDVAEKVIGVKVIGGHLEALGVVGTVDAESYREKVSSFKTSLPMGLGKIGIGIKNLIAATSNSGASFYRSNSVAKSQLDTQNQQEQREKQNADALQSIATGMGDGKEKKEKKKGNWLLGLLGGLLGLDMLAIMKGGASVKGIPKIFKAFSKVLIDRFKETLKGVHSGIKNFLGKFGINIPDMDEKTGKITMNAGKEAAEDVGEKAAKGAGEKVVQTGLKGATKGGGKLAKALSKFTEVIQESVKILKKIPLIGKLVAKVPIEKIIKGFTQVGEKLAKKAIEGGAEAAAKAGVKGLLSGAKQLLTASGVGIIINVGFTAIDVISAVMGAKKVFGIEQVTWKHKLACGLSGFIISACTSIPVLGWLFIFADVKWIAPLIFECLGGDLNEGKEGEEGSEKIKMEGGVDTKDYVEDKYNLNENSTGTALQGTAEGKVKETVDQTQKQQLDNVGGYGWGGFIDKDGKLIKFGGAAAAGTATASATTSSATPGGTTSSTGVGNKAYGTKPKFYSQKTFLASLNIGDGTVKDSGCAIAVAKMIAEFMGKTIKDMDLYTLAKKHVIADKSIGIKYFSDLGGTVTQSEADLQNAMSVDGSAVAFLKDNHYVALLNKKGTIFYGDPMKDDWETVAPTDARFKGFTGLAVFGAIATKLSTKSIGGGRGEGSQRSSRRSIGYGSETKGKAWRPSPSFKASSSKKESDTSIGSSIAAPAAAAAAAAAPAATTSTGTLGNMTGDFGKALEMIWELEGGNTKDGGYVVDTGGPTRYGITQENARIHTGYTGDMRQFPKELAVKTYTNYWNNYGLNDIKGFPLAVAMYNTVVNSGPARASKFVTRMLGLPESKAGKLKPDWVSALNAKPAGQAGMDFINQQDKYYDVLVAANAGKYGPSKKGWHNRTAKLKTMLGASGGAGGGPGTFVSQGSMTVSKAKLGGTTVAQSGCAIAVARMILGYFGKSRSESTLLVQAKQHLAGDNVKASFFTECIGGVMPNNVAVAKISMDTNGSALSVIITGSGRPHWVAVIKDSDKMWIGDPSDNKFKPLTWNDLMAKKPTTMIMHSPATMAKLKDSVDSKSTTSTTSTDSSTSTGTGTDTGTATAAPTAPPPPTAGTTKNGGSQWGGFIDKDGKLIKFGAAAPVAPGAPGAGITGGGDAPWIDVAKSFIGTTEEKNPDKITMFLGSVMGGNPSPSTSWCGAFVSYCIKQALPSFKGSPNSQYPIDSKEYIKLDAPKPGAVVVWKNTGKEGGHTAFFLSEPGGGKIETIGGNQSMKGTDDGDSKGGVSTGPTSKNDGDGGKRKLMGFFWPVTASQAGAAAISNTGVNAASATAKGVTDATAKLKPTKNEASDDKPGKEQVRAQRELPLGITERLARATGVTSKVNLPSVGDHTVPGSGTTMKKAKNDMLWGAAAKIGNAVLQNTAMKDSVLGKGVTDLLDRLIKVTEDNKKVQEKLLDVNKQQVGHLKETAKNTKAPPVNTTTVVNKEPEDLYSYASGIFKEFIKN